MILFYKSLFLTVTETAEIVLFFLPSVFFYETSIVLLEYRAYGAINMSLPCSSFDVESSMFGVGCSSFIFD